jgi:hypothetical protein
MSVKSTICSIAIAAALLAASNPAAAVDDLNATFSSTSDAAPSTGAMAVDLLVVRPLSFAGTLIGTAVFVIGLPFEALSGDVAGPAHRLVGQPAAFTFTRPLGDTGGRID